jgi:non-ribosomal peptide synthase protein (TIGR01720 family)
MELARRHDALRLRIERLVSGFWQVASSSRNGCPFAEIDVSSVPDGRWSGLLAAIEAQARVGFDVTRGPLLRVARVKSPADRPSRLLLVVHRLAADAASWPVLLAELDRVCRPPDTPPASPPRAAPISFRRWAEQVSRHSPSAELPESAHREASTPFLLVDHPERRSRTRGVTLRTISTHLSTELTSTLLCRVAETLRAEIEEVLLAAVLRVLARRSATPALRVDVEGSRSRRFLDLPDTTATIGPFGNVFPLRMELGADTSPTEALRRVKQRLRSLEGDGLLYGQLRYLRPQTETATRLRAEPPADVLVGFLGNLDVPGGDSAGWLAAVADGVQVLGPRGLYNRPLEVTGCVLAGRLRVDWTYNGLLFRRGTIESLAREGVAALGELIEEGAAGGSAYAPAEFSEADLSHDELERLVEEFAEADFDEEDE